MILSIRMNSIVQGSTHRIFSCSSSESLIPVRPELPNLRDARATGIVASVIWTVVNYADPRDIDHHWRSRLVTSSLWFYFLYLSRSINCLSSNNRPSSYRISSFNLLTDDNEIPSIACKRSFTLLSGIIVPLFSFSTNQITLNINCFSSFENSTPVGISLSIST